ncbi:MAG: hypothetical protein H7Y86_14280 [Rhizobacter sp.]|nr:hypothetical protein [Ferruginibacter sp.]
MKKLFARLYGLFVITLLFSCNSKSNLPSSELINEIDLKRGDVILCGAPSGELGSVNFEISNTAVQKDFDLAISILHSFEYDEAEKVFAKIIDKEPACAMAYWGVAMSNYHPLWESPNKEELQKGAKAIALAQSIQQITAREKDYINAMSAFYTDWEKVNHRSRSLQYNNAMEKLFAAYPADKEAAVFYALSLNATADPADKSFANQKKAYKILTALYPGQPDHPGIIHYIIHSYDYPGLAMEALPAARKYAAIAPASAHAQHMPSHIFTRLGLWDECIRSNLQAAAAARCYAEGTGNKAHWDEELHMIDYLMYAYLQKGDNEQAKKQWEYLNTIKEVKPYNFKVSYCFAAVPARYVLENKLWKEAAASGTYENDDRWKEFPLQTAILHFTRALGAAHTGDIVAAKKDCDIMQVLHDTLMSQKDVYKARQVMVQMKTAQAWISLAEGNRASAFQTMELAADMEDETEKHPVSPGEVLPAREMLADMWLQLNNPVEALKAYEADLLQRPNRFNALYGAAMAAELSGNKTAAEKYYRQLLIVVGNTQSARPELLKAKSFLENL